MKKMPWMTGVEFVLDVGLRIPPLFLMDSVLNHSFLAFIFPYDPHMSWNHYLIWLAIMSVFFLFGLGMFFLSIRQLLKIYSYVVNLLSLILSFWWNQSYVLKIVNEEIENAKVYTSYSTSTPTSSLWEGLSEDVYKNFFAQMVFAWLFYLAWTYRVVSWEHDNFSKTLVQTGIHISFISPMMLRAMLRDIMWFHWTPVLAMLYPMIQIVNDFLGSITNAFFMMRRTYNIVRITVSAIGLQAFIENQWLRLHIPQVLRVFCLTRIAYQLSLYLNVPLFDKPPQLNTVESDYKPENLTLIAQTILVRSCETFISLLGTTSIVSFIAHYMGLFMAFCVGSDTEEDRNMGTVSAILFFILALQTGLTGLEPHKRLVRLYRNFSLLSTAILHFIHSMLNPLLLSLSASRNASLQKHIRALSMCAFLVVFPSCLLYYLWSRHSASPWLLAVTAFSVEVIIKVCISLMVYSLFIIDAYRDTFWEKLDDYVYYVQSTGNTIEFLFGIFLFCNGGWIMVFESGGAIRAIMMCVHAYFNIWVQAKEGWKVFMNRRTAVKKINSLREASAEELHQLDDVCAICYQELKSARVTRCKHYFHSVCLRKWLYVQDNCPLCHEIIYKPETGKENDHNPTTEENLDLANQNNMQDAHNMANNVL